MDIPPQTFLIDIFIYTPSCDLLFLWKIKKKIFLEMSLFFLFVCFFYHRMEVNGNQNYVVVTKTPFFKKSSFVLHRKESHTSLE